MFVRWLVKVLNFRYCDSDNGERRAIEPEFDVRRISCSGIVASAAIAMASGVAGRMVGALVRGRRVIVEGRWPPRENVVR